jgi:hypothetical protein
MSAAPASRPSMSSASQAELVEAVALRVVELLREEGLARPTASRLVTVGELASRFGVTPAWVYEHQAELGVRRLGGGRRARLRFDPETAERSIICVTARESQPAALRTVEPKRGARRRRPLGTNVELLPIRGREAA